ncbi:ABC-2 type transport system ATP-binding protein [Actinomadura hallensis]|uniref:ABC-2 type transport system ATP-binding protein n=1 Tax=Actinomadura hallensis TaxID=337895 RepID=A0A543IMG2_9ACTN|nr:alpha/beta fold hydrolase [Actinomadura hallensis]TQM71729.1 ABC-2 type transport system ATP-binding protein [Actinomadura hallensis]
MGIAGALRARWGRTGRAARRTTAAAAAALAAGAAAWGVAADGEPPVRSTEQRITVPGGPEDDPHVTLDTTFYEPAGRDRAPAILLAHGFGGSKHDVAREARGLARAGYAVLTWSARGFGRSTGHIALNSPDHEVQDARRLVDWLARRPEVRLDRPGDPRVGMTGQSYGGAIALMTAAHDPRIDAIAPRITWHSLPDALFPEAAGAGPSRGVFKKLWAGMFFTGSAGRTACGRFLPSLCDMYEEVAEKGRPTAKAVETLRRSSPASVADRIRVPALIVQGQSDSLFPLGHADANARAIARNGAPVSVVWYQGGHDGGDDETERLEEMIVDFFDARLDGSAAPRPDRFTVTRPGGLDSSTAEMVVEEATTRAYPGLSGDPVELPLAGPGQSIRRPAGGSPAAISALPGLGALGSLDTLGPGAADALPSEMPGQSAFFETRPLERPVQLTGAATVRLQVDGDGPLFAKLYDVAPGGTATLARRLSAPFQAAGGEVTVTLPAMDHRFDRGHRIRLAVSTTDMGFATPAKPATYKVRTTSPLTVPTVPSLTTASAPVPHWVWALPLGAIALALVIALPGRHRQTDEEDSDLPLEITGLTKTYKNGHLAVADLSFQVEKGQVLGLLGPNGAGKTTTLRMLMGLIHPDSGEIRIFGHRVRPGAPVLSRLGSFVEGPGFLPHLTGRDNLNLYWRATGRPLEDAHMDEALQIADLGSALDRPVRTYSQGMRQRLAIAQAMLGLPDLLVLDEPTNGLDPPQIREMREVLVRYAAAGRTVIISSHLLAEVEQVCTHAVVMSGGRRVAAGPVADIVGPSGRRLEDAFLEIIREGP